MNEDIIELKVYGSATHLEPYTEETLVKINHRIISVSPRALEEINKNVFAANEAIAAAGLNVCSEPIIGDRILINMPYARPESGFGMYMGRSETNGGGLMCLGNYEAIITYDKPINIMSGVVSHFSNPLFFEGYGYRRLQLLGSGSSPISFHIPCQVWSSLKPAKIHG